MMVKKFSALLFLVISLVFVDETTSSTLLRTGSGDEKTTETMNRMLKTVRGIQVVRSTPLPASCQNFFQVTTRSAARSRCQAWHSQQKLGITLPKLMQLYRRGLLFAQKQGYFNGGRRSLALAALNFPITGQGFTIDVNSHKHGFFSISVSINRPRFSRSVYFNYDIHGVSGLRVEGPSGGAGNGVVPIGGV